MRIALYDPYLDSLGGGERYMLTMAECLSQDHLVEIFWDDKEILGKANKKLGLSLDKVTLSDNIFRLGLVKRLNESKKYDLIIVLSDGSIPLLFSKKTILHFQFPIEWVNFGILDKYKISRISKVICNSRYTKNYIDKKLKLNTFVLYPPVDIAKFIPGLKKKNVILSVGRFSLLPDGSDFKKFKFMLEAFAKMVELEKLKEWKFVIALSHLPKDYERVQELKSKFLGKNIEFMENLDNKSLTELFNTSKIYWHAAGYGENLEKHPERAEHFGITTVEAMAAGLVPVVINLGGQKEIIEDGKNGFLWDKQADLIGNTMKIIKDKSLFDKVARQATNSAKIFDNSVFCKNINDILK